MGFCQKSQTATIIHKGLQQYLEEQGADVTNIGIDGDSNQNQISRLKLLKIDSYDFIVWFQSHPFQDELPKEIILSQEPIGPTKKSWNNKNRRRIF